MLFIEQTFQTNNDHWERCKYHNQQISSRVIILPLYGTYLVMSALRMPKTFLNGSERDWSPTQNV